MTFITQGFIAPFDLVRAGALWRKACDGNHAYACAMLGNAYASGEGVPRDAAKATKLWKKACAGKARFPAAAFACSKATVSSTGDDRQ